MEEGASFVVDVGSTVIRMGPAGDDTPAVCAPLLPPTARWAGGSPSGAVEIDEYKAAAAEEGDVGRPLVAKGLVQDWDRFEALVRRGYHAYHASYLPEGSRLLVTERPNVPRADREKLCQIAFESWGVADLILADRAVLSLNASGVTSGLSLHVGHELTWLVPVVDNHAVTWASQLLDLGCEHLFRHFLDLLGLADASPEQLPALRSIFHEVAEASSGDATETMRAGRIREEIVRAKATDERSFLSRLPPEVLEPVLAHVAGPHTHHRLPDGSSIAVWEQRYRALAPLFQFEDLPHFSHTDPRKPSWRPENIMDILYEPLNSWSLLAYQDNRAYGVGIWRSTCLTGGGALFKNLGHRIQEVMLPREHNFGSLGGYQQLRIRHSQQPREAAWVGGSIIASLNHTWQNAFTQAFYEEEGPRAVHHFFY